MSMSGGPVLERVRAIEDDFADAMSRMYTVGNELATLRARLETEAEADESVLERLQHDREQLATSAAELERVETLIAARRHGRTVDEQLRRATDEAQEARGHAQELREALNELVAARLDNMAGELAGLLSDGDPCAVCGSTEHPRLAEAARIGFTRAKSWSEALRASAVSSSA